MIWFRGIIAGVWVTLALTIAGAILGGLAHGFCEERGIVRYNFYLDSWEAGFRWTAIGANVGTLIGLIRGVYRRGQSLEIAAKTLFGKKDVEFGNPDS